MTEKKVRYTIRKKLKHTPEYLAEVMREAQLILHIAENEYMDWNYMYGEEDARNFLYCKRLQSAAVPIVFKKLGLEFHIPKAFSENTILEAIEIAQNGGDESSQDIYELLMDSYYLTPVFIYEMEQLGCEVMFLGADLDDIKESLKELPRRIRKEIKEAVDEYEKAIEYPTGTYLLRLKGYNRIKKYISEVKDTQIQRKLNTYLEDIQKRLIYLYGVNWQSVEHVIYRGDIFFLYMLGEDEDHSLGLDSASFCTDAFLYVYGYLCLDEYLKKMRKENKCQSS